MREHFIVPDNYFMSHSVGCLPVRTEADLSDEFFQPWASGRNWADWMEVLETFRLGLAALLTVKPDEICPQVNISSALTKVLYSLPDPTTKNVILLSEKDFPTIGFVFERARRRGYEIRFVKGCPTDLTHWEQAFDDNVAIVHITHALSNTSQLLPVADICRLAKARDALTIVDIAQSFGVAPIDLKGWGVDFAIGTGVKFLCFGPGACFLYASKKALPSCHPIDVGWFSHENPFEMDISHFKYAEDAMRFFGGTPSPAPYVMANTAMKVWSNIGLSHVQTRIQTQLDKLTAIVPENILVSPRAYEKRGATLVINPKDREPLRQSLKEQNILHDERNEGFRCSVHGYTSDEDTTRLKTAIAGAF